MGIGLIDIDTKDCMMLRAHQSLNNKELSLRNKTMVDFYISVIKRYRKELLKLSTLIVADAYFSTRRCWRMMMCRATASRSRRE